MAATVTVNPSQTRTRIAQASAKLGISQTLLRARRNQPLHITKSHSVIFVTFIPSSRNTEVLPNRLSVGKRSLARHPHRRPRLPAAARFAGAGRGADSVAAPARRRPAPDLDALRKNGGQRQCYVALPPSLFGPVRRRDRHLGR